jgi:hypothetical protein
MLVVNANLSHSWMPMHHFRENTFRQHPVEESAPVVEAE